MANATFFVNQLKQFRMNKKMEKLQQVLSGLMKRYTERVPDVGRIIGAMKEENLIRDAEEIENDHIAFRTMGVPNLSLFLRSASPTCLITSPRFGEGHKRHSKKPCCAELTMVL